MLGWVSRLRFDLEDPTERWGGGSVAEKSSPAPNHSPSPPRRQEFPLRAQLRGCGARGPQHHPLRLRVPGAEVQVGPNNFRKLTLGKIDKPHLRGLTTTFASKHSVLRLFFVCSSVLRQLPHHLSFFFFANFCQLFALSGVARPMLTGCAEGKYTGIVCFS